MTLLLSTDIITDHRRALWVDLKCFTFCQSLIQCFQCGQHQDQIHNTIQTDVRAERHAGPLIDRQHSGRFRRSAQRRNRCGSGGRGFRRRHSGWVSSYNLPCQQYITPTLHSHWMQGMVLIPRSLMCMRPSGLCSQVMATQHGWQPKVKASVKATYNPVLLKNQESVRETYS